MSGWYRLFGAIVLLSALWRADAGPATCLIALHPVLAGTVPGMADFAETPCPRAPVAAFHYDRSIRYSRASRDIAGGEIVRRFAEFSAAVRPGQTLSLLVRRGAVQVERNVVALQAASKGQWLFVRSNDGSVLRVEFGGE